MGESVTSLQETLPALSAALPEIPTGMADLTQQGEALQQAAVDLFRKIQEKRSHAADLLGQVQQALGELARRADEGRAGLGAVLESMEARLAEAVPATEEAGGAFDELVDGAEEAMTTLEEDLGRDGTTAKEADQGVLDALGTLEDALRTGQTDLGEAHTSASEEAEALRKAAEEAGQSVLQETATLRQQMENLLAQARSRIQGVLQGVRGLESAHHDHVATLGERLRSGKDEVLTSFEERIETELRERIGASVGIVIESLGGLDRVVSEATETASVETDVLKGLFEALQREMEPFVAGLESVKEAAQGVGLTWE